MKAGFVLLGWYALAVSVTGCGTVRVEPVPVLPPALVEKLPVTIGIHYPAEFRAYAHKETRYGTDFEVTLGPAHVAELNRLLGAMFNTVVELEDPARAPALQPPMRMVLEPRFENFAFLTPRDMAGDYFTVTIRYRLNVYEPGGERVDGYVFTGYGREKSSSLTGNAALLAATQRAMREAASKLAVELPEEETVRLLLSGQPVAPRRDPRPDPREELDSLGTAPPQSGLAEPVPASQASAADEVAVETEEEPPVAPAQDEAAVPPPT